MLLQASGVPANRDDEPKASTLFEQRRPGSHQYRDPQPAKCVGFLYIHPDKNMIPPQKSTLRQLVAKMA
jgi:hypothetical protein